MLDAPYCDYFRVETQWVVASTSASPQQCSVGVSAAAVFSKSTLLKSTIRSKTLSGMKESLALWIKLAKINIKKTVGIAVKGDGEEEEEEEEDEEGEEATSAVDDDGKEDRAVVVSAPAPGFVEAALRDPMSIYIVVSNTLLLILVICVLIFKT